jgi:phosphoglycerate dehydrogenase-like enzyme
MDTKMTKRKFAIVNSSSFGKYFPDHIERIKALGELKVVTVAASCTGLELARELEGVHGIVASVTPKFDSVCLNACPDLVLLARHGIGCDNVDLASATELGIMVSRVQGMVEQEAVAEMAVGLMLAAGRYMHAGYVSVTSSRWSDRARYLGPELKGKKIGLLGLGNIGRRVSEIVSLGFKAEVIAYDPYLSADEIRDRNAEPATLEQLISDSDVISFHCPLTDESRRMLSREAFSRMKKGVVLVNTCRGELLDEDALVTALTDGTIRMYGTDVVEGEPIDGDHRLLGFPNVLITPHLGGYSDESLKGMGQTMVDDIEAVFRSGELPGQLANPEVLEKGIRKPE